MVWKIRKRGLVVAMAAFAFASQAAFAGPLDEARGRAHLDAVAAGNLDALMADYAEDAYMEWVGGPLDGRYHGKAEIQAVWKKWIAANAGKARPASFGKLSGFANPRGTSLEAKAEYGGVQTVKVLHVLTYRDGELTTEVWQIAPALKVE